ncbi:glycosyltransferase family 2 protein [Kitasatospora sp. NPDC056184]|uniref:glycosyltransferase family 2 protein n=1 Tax=Kitasatospora sp. NPDC056184 TaxID=3345738 RepID=UPI0035D5E2B6
MHPRTRSAPAGPAAVVIPTRGDHERLRVTLACLAAQTGAPGHRVVVVDDNDPAGPGAEGLAGLLGEARDWLPLRVVPGPGRGRAAARNAGAAAAEGVDWLVFLDADVIVGPGFLAAYAEAVAPDCFLHGRMRELPTSVRLLGEVADAPPETVRELAAGLGDPAAPPDRNPRRRTVANALERAVEAMADGTVPDIAPWLGLIGANSAVPWALWRESGGFDEEFGRVWGCEDLELGLRLHDLGARRRLVPGAFGVHLSHARPDRWEQHDRNLARFAELHPRPSVRALTALLGPEGSPERYAEAVLAVTAGAP